MPNIDMSSDSLRLPLELLDYAHEKIFDGLTIGEGHLQETWPVYAQIIKSAMIELHRLYVESVEK